MIPIYEPIITKYTASAHKALDSGWISSQGEFIQKTTDKLRELLGIRHAVLMNNGTSATHMLFRALRYKYPDLERIYVPNNVFVAVWNTALYEYPPSMLEVLEMNAETLNMRVDESYIRSLKPNSAVVVVHNVGNIVNVPRLQRIRPDLVFVEDNCEGFLGRYEGKYSGTASFCSAVSFFANKHITSGEGGAFFTNDEELYKYIHKSCHHGMTSERYKYDVLGYNYRMTNIQAALLYEQLLDIEYIFMRKQTVFRLYNMHLYEYAPKQEPDTEHSYWMYTVILPPTPDFQKRMAARGVDVRPFFYSIEDQLHLKSIPATSSLGVCAFMLPSSPMLKDVTPIVNALKEVIV